MFGLRVGPNPQAMTATTSQPIPIIQSDSPRRTRQTARVDMGTPKMADGHRGIDPDTPLRLNMAIKIAFPAGGMTASGLRAESGSSPKSEKRASSSAERHGSSETARTKNARAALEKTARELKGRSLTTSPANTKSAASATVPLLKSSSSTS